MSDISLNVFGNDSFYDMANKRKRRAPRRYCQAHDTYHLNGLVHTAVGAVVTLALVGGLLGAASRLSQN